MKQLRPIIVKPEYYEIIEKALNRFWGNLFYKPIVDIMHDSLDLVLNDSSFLTGALLRGRIQFNDGKFSGSFNSKIVKELDNLGAVFDKRTGAYIVSVTKLPPSIQSTIALSQARFERVNKDVYDYIGGLNNDVVDSNLNALNLDDEYLNITGALEKDYQDSIKNIIIEPNISPGIAQNLANNYSENMNLYIKKWTDENILKLREEVYKNTLEGYRAENLVKIIQSNYNVSLSKANFLSRQETSLLTSKFRQERYQDAGINEYKWRTRGFRTRPDHKLLNNTVQSWSTPPVTNRKTGAHNHPGEDYGCVCTAIPLVRF